MGVTHDRSCRFKIEPGWWRHYKGNYYYVIGTGRHTETEESVVIYLDSINRVWTRPLEMFLEVISVDGQEMERFSFVGPNPTVDLTNLPKSDLSTARSTACRMAINFSFDHLSRWVLKSYNAGIPYRMAYSDPRQRILTSVNYNKHTTGTIPHKTPFTLSYEIIAPKRGKKMETWASFSNRIERS
jgi:hypothetical protein